MTIDLRSPDAPDVIQGDVCIVGAGTAGAFLANRLVNAGTVPLAITLKEVPSFAPSS